MFLLSKYVHSLLQDAKGKSPSQLRELVRRMGYELDIYEMRQNCVLYIAYNLTGDYILLRHKKGEWEKVEE
ncbi:MAG: hypothetical protein DRI61_08980 [Chloroflexi bacterium]|nr:MAG: hypothetical protein DRI61_08980 [Chloroflexota bacterium]